MRLSILYFARLRDLMGRAAEQLDVPPEVATVGQLRAWLVARGAPWNGAFEQIAHVRAAVDQAIAADATRLHDGAEVAFFPPVTGG